MNWSVLNMYLFVPIDDAPNHLQVKRNIMCAVCVKQLSKASQAMHHHYHWLFIL
jgi:hypothetical protein